MIRLAAGTGDTVGNERDRGCPGDRPRCRTTPPVGVGVSLPPRAAAGAESTPAQCQPRRMLGALLLAAYAVPVFLPPRAAAPAPLALDASLMERLFPGVPGYWVGIRLLCLLGAALCVAAGVHDNPLRSPQEWQGAEKRRAIGAPLVWLAFALAVLQVIAGLRVSRFDRTEQLVYVASFALAPLLLVCRRPVFATRVRDWRPVLLVAIIVAVWLVVGLPGAWRSSRAPDAVDAWIGVQQLEAAADPAFNLVTGRFRTGGGSVYLVLQGAGVLPLVGAQSAFAVAQAAQFLWLGVSGVAVGLLMGRLVGTAAVSISTATFLFSPFTQMMLLTPLALFFGPLMTIGLLILLVKVHDQGSVPALVGLGGLAGLAATQPAVALVAVGIFAAALWCAWQRAGVPKPVAVMAILLFVAGGLSALPSTDTIRSMLLSYAHGRAQWVGHEMAGFGQISAAVSEYTVEAAIPRPADTAISALLAPFALPRTPLRLLGDVLFDPFGSALAAIGIALCLHAARTCWFARVILGIFAAAIVPGCVASADRISIIRLMVTPVPMAILAGIGWEGVRQWFGPVCRSTVATALATAAVAAGGIGVFKYVNPHILASSWIGLTLQAMEGAPPASGVVVFDHPDPHTFPYWYLNGIMSSIPHQPVVVRVYDGVGSLRGDAGAETAGAELFFWSPALEEDLHVSHAICEKWPRAALYTLVDGAGVSRVFVARPHGPAWKPALPDRQWRVEACGAALPTEATWAADVLRQARTLAAQGHQPDAHALLRAAARKNFCQTDLFEAAADAVLASAGGAHDAREASHWARRACQVTRFRDAVTVNTLAAAYAAAGQFAEAVGAARQARALAVAQGNDPLVATIDRQLRGYEAATLRK